MTDVIVFAGFLGSGKTTVLNQMMQELEGKKVGLIVNEFGKQSVDDVLIQERQSMMKGLANGSIFCSCLKHQFFDALDEFLNHDLDALLVEASGLSDPSSMKSTAEALNLSKDRIERLRIVCVVDAVNYLELSQVLPVLERQVSFSDLIILNKTAMVEDERRTAVIETLNQTIENGTLIEFDGLENRLFEAIIGSDERDFAADASTNTRFNREKSIVIHFSEMVQRDNLLTFLENIRGLAYRIKGFCKTERGNVVVNVVNDDIILEPWDKPLSEKGAYLTIIALKAFGFMAKINQALEDQGIAAKIDV
ncbi:MAG TPA: GTP-binding protein [Clostridiaceae bacterium]|nr:GTP-binding protein [Clostridiaceae bacterium]